MESTERQMGSSFIGAVFGSIATFIRRVAKATILIAWLFVLVLLGAFAASGQASKIIIDSVGVGPSRAYIGFEFRDDRSGYVTAASVLEDFSWRFKNPPPIEALLTKADPGWRSVDLYEAAPDEDQRTQATWVRQQYEDLFDGAAGKIFALVLDASSDPRATTVNYGELTPVNFRTDFVAEYIEFPHEVIAWIFAERERVKDEEERIALLDTFVLVIALGTFGSLIFMTRDYIVAESMTSIGSYVFRPVLGALLAVAIFVIDILAHAVVSNAGILSVRHETLFVLALGAGLLSERAYWLIGQRADQALNRFGRPVTPRQDDTPTGTEPDGDKEPIAGGNGREAEKETQEALPEPSPDASEPKPSR